MNFNGKALLNGMFRLGMGGALLGFLGCDAPYDGVYRKTVVKVEDVMVTEEDGYAVISYSLNRASDEETRFIWSTEDGTAVAGLDYTSMEGQEVVIPAGMKEGVLRIPLLNDSLSERSKKFKVVIIPVEGIERTESELEATATIMDNDLPPALSIEDVTVDEGGGRATLTYTLSALSGRTTSFSWSTVEGSAKGDKDYIAQGGQEVFIPKMITTGQLSIALKDDPWDEPNESFKVVIAANSLSGFYKQGNHLEATVTVTDNDSAPSVSLSDVVVVEGSREALVTYTLSAVSGRETRFSWSTQNGTATGGEDYTTVTNEQVVIPPNTLNGTFRVSLSDDNVYEGPENFDVAIASASLSYVLEAGSDLTGRVTLNDNESMPVISLSDVQVGEGDGQATVNYTLNVMSKNEVSFNWSTQDGTALAGADYTAVANRRIAVPARQLTGTLSVTITDDALDENRETLSAVIHSSSLSGIESVGSDLSGAISILDNDNPPTLTLSDVGAGEEDGHAVITYSLSTPSGRTASFSWSTRDGSAKAGQDYTASSSNEVSIPAGTTTGRLRVPLLEDLLDEDDERFKVVIASGSLSAIRETGSDLEATVTLTDNDASPTISLADVSVGEQQAQALVTYTLSAVSGRATRFRWSTQNGTATGGEDYTAVTNEQVVIPANTLSGTFRVTLGDDNVYEGPENFGVAIASASLIYVLEAGSGLTARVTLNDNESMPVISLSDVQVGEGDGPATVTYTLNIMSKSEVSFNWSTQDGTALSSGADYTAVVNRRIAVPARRLTGTLSVTITDDALDEDRETLSAVIHSSSLSGIQSNGGDLSGAISIVDNDNPPTLTLTGVTAGEADGTAVITYDLSGASGRETGFSWSTRDGSAKAGKDYTASSSNEVSIPAGTTTGQLRVTLLEDILDEDDERFKVVIASGSLSAIRETGSHLEATVTLTDNDASPTISLADVSVGEQQAQALVTYTLSAVSGRATRFRWSTQNGTATGGEDYTAVTNEQVVIPANTLSGTFRVTLGDDNVYEGPENFGVAIASASLIYVLEAGSGLTARVTLNDNESMPVISLSDVQVGEGDGPATVTYTLNIMSKSEVSFNWSTQDGTALSSGADYTAVVNRRIAVSARQLTGTLSVTITDDALDEDRETLSVVIHSSSLSGIQSAESDLSGAISIVDNDNPPTLTLTGVTAGEADGTAVITYDLSGASGRETGFSWSTRDGSAKGGQDYTASSSNGVSIPAGTTTGQLRVPLLEDILDEDDESFKVVIASGSLSAIRETGSHLEATVTLTDNDASPTISLADVSVGEQQAQALVTYTLSAVSGRATRFRWSTQNGTATGGEDYTAVTNEQVVIPANTLSGTFRVTLGDDNVYEGPENFGVAIASASLIYVLEAGSALTARVTLNDNESMPVISLSDVQVGEAAGQATVTYTLNIMSKSEVSFNWSTQDGTALSSGGDYTAVANKRIAVSARQLTGTLSVTITDDALDENRETLSAVIHSSSLSGIQSAESDLSGAISIVDNDNPPTLTLTGVTAGEADGTAVITYDLSGASGRETGFSWSTRDGSAKGGQDYTASSSNGVSIPAGTTTGQLRVPLLEDILDEADESFKVVIASGSLSAIRETGSDLEATVTLTDNDDSPTISLADVSVGEQQAAALVTYTLSAVSGRATRFRWSTQNGTATGGEDYTTVTNEPVVIPANTLSGTFRVTLSDDNVYEGPENFDVAITSASLSYVLEAGSDLTASVTLNDNESMPVISLSDVQVGEGDGQATVTYTLNLMSKNEVSFNWSTQDGTALAGADYTAMADRRIAVPAGQLTGTLSVTITDDALDEDRETFRVAIDSLSGIESVGSDLSGAISILDNDDPPTLTLTGVTAGENQGTAVITYDLSGASGRETGFRWSTRDGTALASADYRAVANKNVTIPVGQARGTFSVSIINDSSDEPNERFKVVIAPASLSFIGTGGTLQAVINITDNDPPPTISIADVVFGEKEGDAIVVYTLSVASGKETSFSWSTQDGTALAGADYTAVGSTTVTVPAGTQSGRLSVTLISDTEDEGEETFKVVINSASLSNIKSPGSDLEADVTINDLISESFSQPAISHKIDILWVIDNSSSMQDEQDGLADNFETFITDFAYVENIDFKMGIITTDAYTNLVSPNPSSYDPADSSQDNVELTLAAAQRDKPFFIENFKTKIKVGITGHSNEKGFQQTKNFLKYNFPSCLFPSPCVTPPWVREGAYMVVIYVSDSNDNSTRVAGNTVADWVQLFKSYKTNSSLLKIYSIITTDTASTLFGERYKQASEMAGGLVGDITGSFTTVLGDFSANIRRLARSFALSNVPEDVDSIVVRVNGGLVDAANWSYDAYTQTLRFHEGSVPQAGETIKISFPAPTKSSLG